MGAEATLKEKGIELPPPTKPSANYVRYLMVGNQLWVSGTGPSHGPEAYRGKVGRDIDLDTAYQSARQCGLNILSTIRDALGSLDRVTQVVKVFGMVNAHELFAEHPRVTHPLGRGHELAAQQHRHRGRVHGVVRVGTGDARETDRPGIGTSRPPSCITENGALRKQRPPYYR